MSWDGDDSSDNGSSDNSSYGGYGSGGYSSPSDNYGTTSNGIYTYDDPDDTADSVIDGMTGACIGFGLGLASGGNKDGESGTGCFVTTAAYGDAHHPMVEAFRSLRDEVLANHKIGRAFTKAYNKVGPVAADFIREKPMVCAAARAVLTPLAKTVQFARGISAEKRQGPN